MSKQNFTPETSVSIVRIKKRPRGRSFAPGNGHGAATRFKPGQSGNPSGRPLCKEITKALTERLGATKPIPAKTGAEKIAMVWEKQARGGNIAAIISLANRVEGNPATAIQVNGGTDNIELLIASMTERSREIGPPDGMQPRRFAEHTQEESDGDGQD